MEDTKNRTLQDALTPLLNEYTPAEIRDALDGGWPKSIVGFIRKGEFEPAEIRDTNDLLQAAGEKLDTECAWDITGETAFIAADGKLYVAEVNVTISPVTEEYARQLADATRKEAEEEGEESLTEAQRMLLARYPQVNSLVGKRVEVVCDNDGGGGDDWAIGLRGKVVSVDSGGYAEVRLDGRGEETYQFGTYQLHKLNAEVPHE